MATGVYIGIGGKAKKVSKMYIGIGGVAKKIKKGYIGVGGVAKLFYNSQPVLGLSKASITLTGATNAYTCNCRGTVFNNRAILLGAHVSGSSTVDTITASLTKSGITINTEAVFATQCSKLPSYAVLGGCGYREGYDERKVSLNSSFTVGFLQNQSINSDKGGFASQTSSYALYLGTYQTVSDDESDYDEAMNRITSINNSLTITNSSNISGLGGGAYNGSAVSLGNVVVWQTGGLVRSINNSLTRSSATPPTYSVWGSGTAVGPYALFATSPSTDTGSRQPLNIYAFNNALTYSLAYTETTYDRWNIAAGSTPSAAVFVGGARGGTWEATRKRVIALDSDFTNVSNGMQLPWGIRDMQSSVLPLGSMAIFAGGCLKGTGVANSTNEFYDDIFAITEQ